MGLSRLLLLWMGFVHLASLDNTFNTPLRKIPPDLPSNITKLNLSHNAIELLQSDIQTLKLYSQLTELHLDNNMLTILPGHMFDSLSQLEILNVSSNNVSRVEPRAFAGLANLRELDLSHNAIVSLPSQVFGNLSHLKAVYLQGNGLHFLENSTLEDLKDANHVDLDENPWNCSGAFLWVMNCQNGIKEKIGQGAVCASPADQACKSILSNSTKCFPEFTSTLPPKDTPSIPTTATREQSTHTVPSVPATATREQTTHTVHSVPAIATRGQTTHTVSMGHTNSGNPKDSNKDSTVGGGSWRFLVGMGGAALGVALLVVCTARFPRCYRRLSLYRHRQLREDRSDLFSSHCHANFSLEAEEEEVETCTQELDISLDNKLNADDELNEDDEDGYIEDGYIEARSYRDQTEL